MVAGGPRGTSTCRRLLRLLLLGAYLRATRSAREPQDGDGAAARAGPRRAPHPRRSVDRTRWRGGRPARRSRRPSEAAPRRSAIPLGRSRSNLQRDARLRNDTVNTVPLNSDLRDLEAHKDALPDTLKPSDSAQKKTPDLNVLEAHQDALPDTVKPNEAEQKEEKDPLPHAPTADESAKNKLALKVLDAFKAAVPDASKVSDSEMPDIKAIEAFKDVPKRQEELDGAVQDLARVAESAQQTAQNTYDKLGRYREAIQKMHKPLHTMTHEALELRKSFQSIWRRDEEERLHAWKALDSELAGLK